MVTDVIATPDTAVTEPEEELIAAPEDDDRQVFVGFVLDQSGSMGPLQAATIDGFNEYINTLREGKSDVIFSLTQFDSDYRTGPRLQRVMEFVKLEDVEPLTDEIYKPCGGTPLRDAVADTIHRTQTKIDELKVDAKVLCVVQTDGKENTSREYGPEAIRELIEKKTKGGWTFVYLGAGAGTWDQGVELGIAVGNIGTYSPNVGSTKRAFRGMAVASSAYAASPAVQTATLYADADVDQDMTDSNVPDAGPDTVLKNEDEDKESSE